MSRSPSPVLPSPTAAWRPDTLDALAAAAFAALAAWSWVGITLAEVRQFRAAWLLVLAGPASIAAAAWTWRRMAPAAAVTRSSATGLLIVVATTAVLVSRPAEHLVDGGDGSVYLNIGRSLGTHGAFVFPAPVLDLIPADRWEALLERERYPPRVFNLFPGGIEVQPGVNAVQPGFFHLYPVWLALAELAGGPRAPYYLSPLLGVIAVTMFWLLARLLSSPAVATLASVLLLVNFGQIWFARVPTTEVMTQALLVTGTLFLVAVDRGAPPAAGVLAGSAFGLAAFARLDVFVLVLPVVAVALAAVWIDRRWHAGWTAATVTLALLGAHAALHAWLLSSLYVERIIFHMFFGRSVRMVSRVLPALLLASAVVALVAARRLRGSAVAARLPLAVFGLLLLGAVIRIAPRAAEGPLALLLTPPGILLVLVAVAFWLYEDRSWPAILIAGLLLLSMLVYGESAREHAMLPMPLRRYVPVVLPFAALAIGVFVHRLWSKGVVWRVVGVSVWTAMAALWVSESRTLASVAPMQHVHGEVARLAAALPPGAIVIADRSSPSHLAMTLWATFGRDVLFVRPTAGTADALRALSETSRRPLVILKGAGTTGLTARDMAGLALSARRVEVLHLTPFESAADRLPRALAPYDVAIEIYDARPAQPRPLPALVEVGDGDLSIVVGGLYPSEVMGTAHARWTSQTAELLLPRVAASGETVLTLRLAAPRPAGVEEPRIAIRIGDRPIGETPPLGPGFTEISVPLSVETTEVLAQGAAVLSLTTPTFVPAAHAMGDDRRPLGVAIDWVRLGTR